MTSPTGTSGSGMEKAELSRDGRLAAVLMGTTIEIWDTAKEKEPVLGALSILDPQMRDRATTAFAFSPDGKSLAVQVVTKDEVNTLTFWDLTTMRQIGKVAADLGYPANGGAVVFQPDGRSVIAAPTFGRVAFPSGEVITKGATGLEVDSISDDGTTLYTHPRGFRPYIRLWDTRTLQPVGQDLSTGPVYPPLSAPERATAVSPDGRLFATVHESQPGYQIKVWDSRTRQQIGVPLTGPTGAVGEFGVIGFTPDGSAVTGVDEYGRFFTYTLAPARLVRDLCATSGPLTEQEWKPHIPDVSYRKTC
ncbi:MULTISPECIES: WD40 repeat domain-containing protein [unclassified Streptomyces]|uniref:WD40 repeat domain-containing protein n=1 Tax=unclassified Streptomyces TaxID=2593676 RepID=UPI003249F4A3